MIVATGVNYVTESFSLIGRALQFGYDSLCDILDSIGLSAEVYFLMILGFFIVYFVVGSVRDYWLGSADSALSDVNQHNRRETAQRLAEERHNAKMAQLEKNRVAFQERTEFYKERNRLIFSSLRKRGRF